MKQKMALFLLIFLLSFPGLTVSAGIFDWPALPPKTASEIFLSISQTPYFFSADELERRLNAPSGSLKGITITRLPKQTEGSLCLFGKPVSLYQRISRDAFESLTFTPSSKGGTVSLSILPEMKDAEQTVLSFQVSSPVSIPIEVSDGEYETLSEVPLYGYLSAYHPNGDFLRTVLCEKPEKGTVSFQGQSFCYEPFPGRKGTDRFAVAFVDEFGNRSPESVQTVTIEPKDSRYDYWDLNGSAAYYSAVKLLQNDIFSGELIGSRRFFCPQRPVNRGELLMLLTVCCQWENELPAASLNTGLKNDAEIPSYLKPYISLGIQKGLILEKEFCFEEVPTSAEAVVFIDRACHLPKVEQGVPGWKDLMEIPDWALQSYKNLSAHGFLVYPDNCAHPNDGLTRENLANMLWQCRKYITNSNLK